MADIGTEVSRSQLEQTLDDIENLKLASDNNDSINTSLSFSHDETDDDAQNEFLHSSTFLSNSQIIRTSNLKNTVSKNLDITSPTRPETRPETESKLGKNKGHFQLFVPKKTQEIINSDDEGHSEDFEEQIGKESTTTSNSSHSSRKTSSSVKYIDIDNPSATPKLPKMRPETTPWRKLRPASTYLPKPDNPPPTYSTRSTDPMSANFIESIFDTNSAEGSSPARSHSLFETGTSAGSDAASSTTAHSTHELEHLRKQITNYKLQQKLLTELIRSIIKNSGTGEGIKQEIITKLERENGILLNDQNLLQKDQTQQKPTNGNVIDESLYNEKIKETVELKNDLISSKNLNEELNNYIEDLKSQLESDSEAMNAFNNSKSVWEQLANDILTLLLGVLDGDSATAVLHARDKSSSIDTKLKVISFAFAEFIQRFEETSSKLTSASTSLASSTNSSELSDEVKSELREKLQRSKQIENDLKIMLTEQSNSFKLVKSEYETLKTQVKEKVSFIDSLKKILEEKRAKITQLNSQVLELQSQLEEMIEAQQADNQGNESQLLRNRLNLVKLNHSKEVEKFEAEIEMLRKALNDAGPRNDDKTLTEELVRKQREISSLNDEIKSLSHQLGQRTQDNNAVIENLKALLQESRNDYDNLQRDYVSIQQVLKETEDDLRMHERDYKKKLEHAAKELNQAVTKQRALLAEKSKQTFALEDIKREKTHLTMNNASLTEKVTRLGYQVSQLSSYELAFASLYQLQVSYLKNTLSDFSDVLEESSVHQAEQKLKKLFDPNLEYEQVHSIIRSLFEYFENATHSLIEDHTELLHRVNKGETEHETDELQDEIDKLTEELQWCYANGDFKNVDGGPNQSPRTKLRFEELEKKRKAEREKRKQEHEAFTKRIKALEKENQDLRERVLSINK